jgi:hypothetical protein
MPAVPEGSDFRRRWAALDLKERGRLTRLARRGGVAKEPEQAALVAAYARDFLHRFRFLVPLAFLGLALRIWSTVDARRYSLMSLLIDVLFVAFMAWVLIRWRPAAIKAERRNREVAEGSGGPDSGFPTERS